MNSSNKLSLSLGITRRYPIKNFCLPFGGAIASWSVTKWERIMTEVIIVENIIYFI